MARHPSLRSRGTRILSGDYGYSGHFRHNSREGLPAFGRLAKKPCSMTKDHLPNLDGTRTIAATLVLLQHANFFPTIDGAPYFCSGPLAHMLFGNADTAVKFFFVLSGFLITRLVLKQMYSQQGFSLTRFWLRRVLRIWPVYYLVVILGIVMAQTGEPLFSMKYNSYPLLFCFLENFDVIQIFTHRHQPAYIPSILWSVSIEEQFYLLYPVVLLIVPRRAYTGLFAVIVLGAGYFRYFSQNEFHTISAFYELGLGCLLAQLVHRRKPKQLHPVIHLLPYLLLIGLQFPLLDPRWASLLRPILFACILYDQAFCPSSLLQTRFVPGLNGLGKITYGLYSYHMIVVTLVYFFMKAYGTLPDGPLSFVLYLLGILGISIGLSWLSYHYYETPLLALSNRKPGSRG
jgi:peptidoglycan/LPS O-acetylase OafA/YrhL